MADIKTWQKRAYNNKVQHGFNTTDVNLEILLVIEEAMELFDAIHRHRGNVGEELADVQIYLFGLAEMLGLDLEVEVERKMAICEQRKYKRVAGHLVKVKS